MTLGYPDVVCTGCGARVVWAPGAPDPFRCPASRHGDDIDHVLKPAGDVDGWRSVDASSAQPFIRYRGRLYSYHLARVGGLADTEFCDIVAELDGAVEAVDGRGFRVTPTTPAPRLARALGVERSGLWVKDETRNVSGSHKGRHLFGVMLYLMVSERLRGGGAVSPAPLAIASCGNAALAAAVVARAAERELLVFIPPSADAVVVDRLGALGARLTICERRVGEAGDPCYLRFREAVDAGAVPFCCQGPDNGQTIEGGKTLAYEAIEALERAAAGELDRVFLQVGGGALASAFIQGLEEASRAGAIAKMPRIHAVQTRGAYPLSRAYDAVRGAIEGGGGAPDSTGAAGAGPLPSPGRHGWEAALADAVRHRHDVMRPWESEPHSIAHGILDDETYDWREIVRGMFASGGGPIVVTEGELRRANALAREATGVDVDFTGSAGLAGLLQLADGGDAQTTEALERERVLVLFTGERRHA